MSREAGKDAATLRKSPSPGRVKAMVALWSLSAGLDYRVHAGAGGGEYAFHFDFGDFQEALQD